MATATSTNEFSFTVIAPPKNKNKPVYILDDDDDDYDHNAHHVPMEMDETPFVKNLVPKSLFRTMNPAASTSAVASLCCLDTGMQSFQESIQLQRELLAMQESVFQGMTQKVIEAQEQVLQLKQEIRQLESDLETTRTFLMEEKEQTQTLTGLLYHYPPRQSQQQEQHPSSSSSSLSMEGLLVDFGSWSRRGGVGGLLQFGHDTGLKNFNKDPGVTHGQ